MPWADSPGCSSQTRRPPMRRMDGVSAFMLEQESTDAYMHTLKISILDTSDIPDGWDFRRFQESLARRIQLLPMLRWKFLRVPFGLHHPVWVDDPDFDLHYHVRRIACPSPGDPVRPDFTGLRLPYGSQQAPGAAICRGRVPGRGGGAQFREDCPDGREGRGGRRRDAFSRIRC